MIPSPDPALIAELRQRLLLAFEAENRRPATVEEYEMIAVRAVTEAADLPPPPPLILPEGGAFQPSVRPEARPAS